jgi:hypothetical protein
VNCFNGSHTIGVYDIEADTAQKFEIDVPIKFDNFEWCCWIWTDWDTILCQVKKDHPGVFEFNVKTGATKVLPKMITGRRDF